MPEVPDRVMFQSTQDSNPYPERSCMNCCWWRKLGFEGPVGVCQRYAPLPDSGAERPVTFLHYWCGDWAEVRPEGPRLMITGVGRAAEFYWLAAGQRSQNFPSREEAEQAREGGIEWNLITNGEQT